MRYLIVERLNKFRKLSIRVWYNIKFLAETLTNSIAP